MERFATVCAAFAAWMLLSASGCTVGYYGSSLPANSQNAGGSTHLTPQEEYDQALVAFEKAKRDFERTRFWAGAPKFYGSGPWAAPVAIGVGLLGHLSVSRAQAALLRATERLERAEDRLLASQWVPAPPADAHASAPPALPAANSPPAPPEPVFSHPCPYCGAGNTWMARRETVRCSSCKKEFRIRYAK